MPEPSPQAPPPLIPDHVMVRVIGRGSYGEVWLAQTVLGESRAVKLIRAGANADGRPFEREFDGLTRFGPISRSHPGLVHILHAGRFEGGFYYVMELADPAGAGAPEEYVPRTLRTDLHRRGRLPVLECVELGIQMTDALAHLHGHGLVHRDIKPSNIIFAGGRPKLADIGLVASSDASMSCVGTEGYLPPEGPGKPPADLYALGKVLYELATGRDRTDFPELPTFLREDPEREALEEFNEVILAACEPEARRRYQTAATMRADLLLLQSGRSLRSSRTLSRRLAIARLAGGVAGGLALVAGGAFWFQRVQTREARRLRQLADGLAARARIQHAEDLFARGDSRLALAHLARVLREDPANRVAIERVEAALQQRTFPRATAPPLMHPDRVIGARFSPDGRRIASLSADRTVQLWDAASGAPIGPAIRHTDRINAVRFSGNSRRLLTASSDRTVRVLDAETGAAAFPPLLHPDGVSDADFHPTQDLIATASPDGRIRLFDSGSGRLVQLAAPDNTGVVAMAFSPDGSQLATASAAGTLLVLDGATLRTEHRLEAGGEPNRVAYSADGSWLAVSAQNGESNRWEVRVWKVASLPSPPAILPHANRINSFSFSPDGRSLASAASDNLARLWDLTSNQLRWSVRHASLVYAAAFSPDGRRVLTASVDKTALVRDIESGRPVAEAIIHQARIIHAEFHPRDGRMLTASWDRTVRLWEVRPAPVVARTLSHQSSPMSAEFDPEGGRVLTATGSAHFTASRINSWQIAGTEAATLWDTNDGTHTAAPLLPEPSGILAARFASGRPLAVTTRRGLTSRSAFNADAANGREAMVWDVATGGHLSPGLPLPGSLTCADIARDGTRVACGTEDGSVRVWEIPNGRELTPILSHRGRINSVRLSPDGRTLASVSRSGTAMLWNVATGTPIGGPLIHGSEVWYAHFNHRGDRLVTATVSNGAVIWSLTGERVVALPEVHPDPGAPEEASGSAEGDVSRGAFDPIEYAEFSPDDRFVLTASGDRARLWDAATGRPLQEYVHAIVVVSARFSPDGLRVLTASLNGTAQLWDRDTGLKLADPFHHLGPVYHVAFSPTGRQAATASRDGTVAIRELAGGRMPVPAPAWFVRMVEAVATQRLNALDLPDTVTWQETIALRNELAAAPDSEAIRWGLSLLPTP